MKPIAIVMSLGLVLLTMGILPTHRTRSDQAVVADDDDGDDDDSDAGGAHSTLTAGTLPAFAAHRTAAR